MKPELTPNEAISIMQDAGSTLSLESFKRCLRQDKIPGYSKAKVTQKFDGWQQFGRGKRIPATALARQLC